MLQQRARVQNNRSEYSMTCSFFTDTFNIIRERVTLVTLSVCAGLLLASICKVARETAQDQHDAFLVLQTS